MVNRQTHQAAPRMRKAGAFCGALAIVVVVGFALWVGAYQVFPFFGVRRPQENVQTFLELFGPIWLTLVALLVLAYRSLRRQRMFGDVSWAAAVPLGIATMIFVFWGLVSWRSSLGVDSRKQTPEEAANAIVEKTVRDQPTGRKTPQANPVLAYLLSVLLDNGWFQPVTVGCFCTAMTVLLFKFWRLRLERRASYQAVSSLLGWPSGQFTVNEAGRLLEKIYQNREVQRMRQTALLRRVERVLERIDNTKSSAGMDELMNSLSGIDGDFSSSSFGGINFLIYLMPAIGFLGTIYGVGQAIYGFSLVIPRAQDFVSISPELANITHQLGVAFDTTLLALVLSAVAGLAGTIIRQSEEAVLGQVDADTVELFRSLTHEDPGTKQIVEAIENLGGLEFTQTLEERLKGLGDRIQELKEMLTTASSQFQKLNGEVERYTGMLSSRFQELKGEVEDYTNTLNTHADTFQQASQNYANKAEALAQSMSTAFSQVTSSVSGEVDRWLRNLQAQIAEIHSKLEQHVGGFTQWGRRVEEWAKSVTQTAQALDSLAAELTKVDGRLGGLAELASIRRSLDQIQQRGVRVQLESNTQGEGRPASTGYATPRPGRFLELLQALWQRLSGPR